MYLGEPREAAVEEMSDQVRHNGRARAALRQFVVMARDLGEDRCDLGLKREMLVLQKKAADAPKLIEGKKSSKSRFRT